MGIELVRFDMSEYMERHTVSRLIGAPPGYVGFDQGGLLTEAITKHPHSVLLLDEIEKAHPDVFNLLLQVMDHGTLTDNNGRKADFRNVMLIMTHQRGGRADEPPVNRIHPSGPQRGLDGGGEAAVLPGSSAIGWTRIVQFSSLSPPTISHVVDKFIIELEGQLEEKRVTLAVDEEARAWLAEHGFDQTMGARPMARTIQEHIKRPLAEELLFGRLEGGGHVRVGCEGDRLNVAVRERNGRGQRRRAELTGSENLGGTSS